jgi:UDP-N-acetylmuramate: L-alanyl-gamma-D-glutamyl-meso-diaminopimelate ligase
MKKIYLIGICGTGVSSLAGLFYNSGYKIAGSDSGCFSPIKEIVESFNIKLFHGYDYKNIKKFNPDLVIIGNIVGRGNSEGEYVLNNNIPYMSMAEALHAFFLKDKERIVVAGTHGKTTTTAFLAYSLNKAGFAPGFFIGGKPVNLASNYSIGEGKYFIIEGDEYETAFFDKKSKFFHYFPNNLILKSLEYDHADIFSSEKEYLKNFENLIKQVPSEGEIFINGNCNNSMNLLKTSYSQNIVYGQRGDSFIRYTILKKQYPLEFEVKIGKENLGKFSLNLIGEYNIENALPSIYYLYKNNMDIEQIKDIISSFKGVVRRQQVLFDSKHIIYIDDFAHHPTAIKQTLESIKNSFPEKKILTVFEPASWSLRKNIFQQEIEKALLLSDIIFILDIKGKDKIKKNERLNLLKIKKTLEDKGKKVKLFIDKNNYGENVLKEINSFIQNPIVILTLSNGKRLSLNEKIPNYLKKLSI